MEKFNEKAIISRIIELRTAHCGQRGKSNFAKSLGISPSTYNYYENDRLPPIKVLLAISEITGADLHWILTGNKSKKLDSKLFSQDLTDKLQNLLEKKPDAEQAVIAFIDLLGQTGQTTGQIPIEKPQSSSKRPGWIPVLGRTAAGTAHFWKETTLPESQNIVTQLDELVEEYTGKSIVSAACANVSVDLQLSALVTELKEDQASLIQINDSANDNAQVVEFVQSDSIHQMFPDAFALQVDGDSMAPRINDGDIVVLSPSVPAVQGSVAVARLKDQIGVTCKLIRISEDKAHMIPINERYQTKTVSNNDLQWALAVICHLKIS